MENTHPSLADTRKTVPLSLNAFDKADMTSSQEFIDNKIEDKGVETAKRVWLSSSEAADYLRISRKSLLNMASNGEVPYYKLQRRNRYLQSDLDGLLLANRRGASNGN